MKELFDGVSKFLEDDFNHYKDLYKSLKSRQKPHTLFITCIDSRIVPNLITKSLPGDLLVVRNIGNIVPPYSKDGKINGYLSTIAAVEYAISILHIKNIIICGHSDCGACRAIYGENTQTQNTPYVKKWIDLLDPVKEKVLTLKPKNKIKRMWLTEQLNIQKQLENLMTYPFVEERFDRGEIRIYGWYYIIPTGEIYNYNMITKEFKLVNKDRR